VRGKLAAKKYRFATTGLGILSSDARRRRNKTQSPTVIASENGPDRRPDFSTDDGRRRKLSAVIGQPGSPYPARAVLKILSMGRKTPAKAQM
jgi:hypothetical protein